MDGFGRRNKSAREWSIMLILVIEMVGYCKRENFLRGGYFSRFSHFCLLRENYPLRENKTHMPL